MNRHPIGTILEQALPATLLRRLALHARILERIRSVLPEPLAEQCSDCVVNDRGQLIVYVSSAAYGAQIRFFREKLLEAVRSEEFPPARQVLVRIRPRTGRS
ncbi:MAG TPA: DciA family protein [Methylococcaceae bacterium]|nr:DciA family protein [Methylococcaceae bacterium]